MGLYKNYTGYFQFIHNSVFIFHTWGVRTCFLPHPSNLSYSPTPSEFPGNVDDLIDPLLDFCHFTSPWNFYHFIDPPLDFYLFITPSPWISKEFLLLLQSTPGFLYFNTTYLGFSKVLTPYVWKINATSQYIFGCVIISVI